MVSNSGCDSEEDGDGWTYCTAASNSSGSTSEGSTASSSATADHSSLGSASADASASGSAGSVSSASSGSASTSASTSHSGAAFKHGQGAPAVTLAATSSKDLLYLDSHLDEFVGYVSSLLCAVMYHFQVYLSSMSGVNECAI